MNLYEIVVNRIKQIEYDFLTGDEYCMLYPKEDIEHRYRSVKIFITKSLDLTKSEKDELLKLLEQKMNEMEEINAQREKKSEEINLEVENAKQRYEKLNFLKKMRLKLTRQTPELVPFGSMSVEEIKNLYSSKKR